MLNINLLKQLLIVSIVLSSITCAFVQKTKSLFKTSKYLPFYSFILNLVFSIIFCNKFTSVSFPTSLWVGLFSFLGADTIFKTLEGAVASHTDLISKDVIEVKKENLIDTESDT